MKRQSPPLPGFDALLGDVRACTRCVSDPDGTALPHAPRPVLQASSTARIAICGQAPGLRVHASGQPFTDASGDRLRAWMDVTTEEFYDASQVAIIPMGFCFPGYDAKGHDLPPRRECAPLWRRAVFAQLTQVELVLVIGAYAMAWHLPDTKRAPVNDVVAAWHTILTRPGITPAILPLPHPSWRNSAWLKAHPWFDADVVPELRRRVRALLVACRSAGGNG